MAPDTTVSAVDMQMVATLREHLSDHLGRLSAAHHRELPQLIAIHIFEGLHLGFTGTGDVEAWVERAMSLLQRVARVRTPQQDRNDISLVPEDVTADVAA